MWAIIGILMIIAGIAVIMFMPQDNAAKPEAGKEEKPDEAAAGGEKSEEQLAKEAAENAANRQQQLEKLVIPGNIPPVRIWFGSQTGTAEKFANVIDEEASTLGIQDSKVVDFNSFSEDEFAKQPLVIVCVATHYEGDPCDNTRGFFKWIKKISKDKTAKPFDGMNFAIFGLGDTSYEQYNEMGRFFNESFEKLGGKRLQDMAVGNAETFSTEDDFNKWKENLWSNIITQYASQQTTEEKKTSLLRRKSSLVQKSDPSVLPWVVDTSELQLADNSTPEYDMTMRNYLKSKPLPIKSIRELRQQCVDGGSTIEVIYDLRGSGLTYKTAANSAIFATNSTSDVEKFAEMFSLDLDSKFQFSKNPEFKGKMTKTPFPIACEDGMSIREALSKHIDLIGPVSKKLLGSIVQFCEAAEDKALLEELTSKAGAAKYDEIFKQRNLGLIDILSVVPSLRLTANFIFQKCDMIKPRYYTITSSALAHPEELTIAISLSRYEVTLPESSVTRSGLVSGYCEDALKRQLAATEDAPFQESSVCFVQDSNFTMPQSHDVPIIMVGPGTGVVPFIGFMQEREQAKANDPETALGPAHLYFGCRQFDVDYIYRDYMTEMKDKAIISELNAAFSRPKEEGAVKAYVQDQLSQHGELIKQVLMEQNGQFFICGATNMGRAVETILKQVIGEEAFSNIQKEKRYKIELWAS